eukprot:1138274-Pelagomonas_calceolata.AAC.3
MALLTLKLLAFSTRSHPSPNKLHRYLSTPPAPPHPNTVGAAVVVRLLVWQKCRCGSGPALTKMLHTPWQGYR